jgi:hypothetical protein
VALGRRGSVPVKGTLNGYEFRSSLMPTGQGGHVLGVHKATREAANVAFGDPVAVEITAAEPPEVQVPAELAEALEAAGVRPAFERLAPSHRREYARWVGEAKRPETRKRRADEAAGRLTGR